MNNPSGMKVLFLDIETSPMEVLAWGLFKQNIAINQIMAPTRIMCWAAKWEGEEEVYFGSENEHEYEEMLGAIYEMIDEADAVCHYNGTAFDMKHLNREFAQLGWSPPSAYKNIDLMWVVKKNFKFPSNKLDYVASVLLDEVKVTTGGMALWIACMNGDQKAWKLMEEYNIQDTLLLERLYERIQGWIKGHPNRALWIEDQSSPICPNCGSTNVVKRGVERPARVNAYQRYKCSDCGANSRGRHIVTKAGEGVLM